MTNTNAEIRSKFIKELDLDDAGIPTNRTLDINNYSFADSFTCCQILP